MNDSVHLRHVSSVNDICGILRSYYSCHSLIENSLANLKAINTKVSENMMPKVDPLQKFSCDLMELWSLGEDALNDRIIEVDYDLFILLASNTNYN